MSLSTHITLHTTLVREIRTHINGTLRSLALLFIMSFILSSMPVSAQKTTRKGLKKTTNTEMADTAARLFRLDTLQNPAEDIIRIYGYEKPLSSKKETIHLQNNHDGVITEILIEISYLDYRDREIHRRTLSLPCNVPPYATRMLTFTSWDVQNRFYFDGGPKPRTTAYPYHVTMSVTEAVSTPVE